MVHIARPLLLLLAFFLHADAETPPRFTRTPVDQTGVSGGVASFICQATGDPRPKIVWNKKGKKVSNQRFEVIEFDDGSGSVLRIQPLRTPRDEAIYECVASNNVGEISVSTRLTVLRGLFILLRGLAFCSEKAFSDHLFGNIFYIHAGALQIEQSEESDQGKYECVATNSAGTRYSAPANLYVRVRRVPPRFSIPPTNHEIMPGGSVNITCVAVGSPMPYVKWMLGAEDLTPEDDMPIGRNVLELNDSANYTCVAMSTLGVIEAIAQITVKALPKPPGTPVVTESTATSITLTWDSGNPEPVSYYIIQHKPKNAEEPYKEIDGVATTRYSVAGLSPYSDYEFRVVAVNNIGRGPPSEPVLTQTSEQAPSSAPRDVQARMLSSTTILVQWKEPEEPNGQIQGYRVYYTMDPTQHVNNWMKHNVADSQITTIGNLVPQKTYSVKVLAFTSIGDGPLSSDIQVITQTGVPGQPLNFKAEPESETSILLSWTPPRSDTIANYELVYKDGEHGEEQRITIEPGTSYRLQGLRPNSLYYFRLAARSPQGLGASTAEISARTMQSMFAKNFHVKAVMKTSVLLSWEIPENYNSAMPFKILYDDGKMVEEVDGRATQKLIVHLKPEKSYSFVLTNRGNSAGGLQHRVTAKTAPDVLRTKPAFIGKTNLDGMITVQLPEVPANENIKGYYIIIVPLKKSRGKFIKPWESPDEMELDELLKEISRKRRSLRHGREVELKPYIAAHFDVLPTEFTLGDDKHYGGFTNKQLQSEYVFFVLAVMEHAESKMYATSPYSDPVVSMDLDPQPITDEEEGLIWVVGPVLAVVFIICIVIAILLYKRKRAESDSRKSSIANSKEAPSHHPTDPVELRRLNFQTPGKKHDSSCPEHGMASHPPIPILELADHIERLKANDNLKFSQEYESIDPGQQFTWEHSNLEVNKPKNRYANVIAYDHSRVLLSAIEGKEMQMIFIPLFPCRGTETHGLVQVTLLDTVELATYCVRTFALYKNGSSEKREVRQFQFTAWPDHGVPEHPTPFLAFLRRVKTCNPPDAGPMVVHCSAGVGRTGCFIVIDAMLERIKHEKTVDIYGHVTLMRAQRNYMVQTEDQYIFIHDALLEAVTCGNTEVPARNLYAYIQKLTQTETGENVTGMELEFKRLASSKAHTSRFISANLPCNKFKNRLVNIMPYESTRVCLQPIRGVEGSDYINASFIDGYRQQKAYIATQGPLAETTEDFWRMLWEHNSTIVVMLTKLREMGREKCHQYWPAERSARYQYFVVDPMDGQSRTVRQFQFTDWPEQGVPKSGEGFIDFIGQVHKTKEQFGQDGPISVHCSAGVGRTGVFITLSIVLERMRYEGVVDIFQTVKMLRTQRPAMVQTEDQYQFCYRAALEYLGSFDHYAT
uniref:Receptor-type tyrosine-protein phosphatase S n=1 Tax=Capra hircus TaxID=9925 RepID=A0A8C2XXX2_CAPHI